LVSRDAVLGRDIGTDHLQRIELAGYLEQRALIFLHGVQFADIALNDPNAR